jgi:hypothetical protein
VQAEAGWFGEGDDFFFVDGEKKPSIEGTGTEDYFNDAWGLRVDTGPYAGASVAEGTGLGSRMTAYRWHLADPIPFSKSLKFVFEHRGWTFNADGSVKSASGERTDLMSSVAYWYQVGVASDQPEPPYGEARLPQGNARQIEVEETALAGARSEKGTVSVSKDLFWSKDVLFLKAEGPGSRLDVPFDVDEDGTYELVTQVAQSFDYGTYATLLDGKPVQSAELEHEPGADILPSGQLDGYKPETYVGLDLLLGWPRLAKGRHVISFVCTGKAGASRGYNLGVDNVILAKVGPEAWSHSVGRQPPADRLRGASIPDLAKALTDGDPIVRGLAALGLKEAGLAALPALDALVARLADSDTGVRMMAANAIAAIGPKAAPAVPALVAAAGVRDEHVHVLRSVADALGSIGPAAASALLALEEIRKLPRARWAAEAAIRKIR